MDVILEDIKACIQKELNAANEKHPLFSSLHEAYAVMLEEYEESAEELEEAKKYLDLAWNQTRLNLNKNASSHIGRLALAAERLAETFGDGYLAAFTSIHECMIHRANDGIGPDTIRRSLADVSKHFGDEEKY